MANVSSTTSSTSTSAYSAHGLSGLASGLDTESMVQAMLAGTQNRIDAQNQKIQVLEWKQSQYRDITKQLLNLQNTYFSFSSGATNLRTASFFNQLNLNSSNSAISLTNSGASTGTSFTINKVTQLAKASKMYGVENVRGDVELQVDFTKLNALEDTDGEIEVQVSLDGVSKTIKINKNAASNTALENDLNEQLKNKFGETVKAKVDDSGKLTFDTSSDHKFSVTINDAAIKEAFGMVENTVSNKLNVGLTLEENFKNLTGGVEKSEVTGQDEDGNDITETYTEYTFKINGKDFKVRNDESITSIMQKINDDADAEVTMSYDSLNDRFVVTSDNTGANIDLEIEDGDGNVMETFFGTRTVTENNVTSTVIGAKFEAGQNAKLVINEREVERNTNSFDVNGVLVTLNKETDEETKVTATSNTDNIVKGITDFVKAYNEMITSVIKKTTESADYADYPALTEAQKKEMSEDEIKKWEEKAKTGLLRGDSTLRGMLSNFRSILYQKAEGGLALYDLGITTNTDGTLKIDEDKVKEMCQTNLEGVKNLFVGNGEIATDKNGNKVTAASNGLANNINIMLDRYAKTSSASAGILVKKAGYENTASDSDTGNSIAKEIKSLKDYLKRLQDKYESERSRYWKKFTSLETLISNSNSISSYFSSMSGY